MSAVIGVDVGSSAIKAVLFDSNDRCPIRSERRELASRVPNLSPECFEEDPVSIRDATFSIITALAQFAKEHSHPIEAIGFTGQMHGGMLVDSALEPLTNFVTWQDKRAGEIAEDGSSYADELRDFMRSDPTGVSIHTGFLIATLYWLIQQKAMPPNAARILGIYDWLASLLAGRAVTDISSAAAWGMYDPVELTWRMDLLTAAEIPEQLLPDVAEPGANLGTMNAALAEHLGLDASVRIHASIGDTQAAYLGSGCTEDEILLNFGTGSQSMWETDLPFATQGTDIRYLRNGQYLACAPTLAGGEAYRIVAEFFQEVVREFSGLPISREQAIAVMDRLAAPSETKGIMFDPIFSGSKFRDDSERASIENLTRENFHPGPLVLALIEGMIEEVAKPYFRRKGEMIHAGLVGAGSAMCYNTALREAAERRFARPLRLAPYPDEAAIGAALLCLGR